MRGGSWNSRFRKQLDEYLVEKSEPFGGCAPVSGGPFQQSPSLNRCQALHQDLRIDAGARGEKIVPEALDQPQSIHRELEWQLANRDGLLHEGSRLRGQI